VRAEGKVSGELVGDVLQEPVDPEQHHSSNVAPTTSAAGGVYRVGGPSTLYGGPGDDAGPTLEVRLAVLREADRELARMRRAALTSLPVSPVIVPGPVATPAPGVPATAGISALVAGGSEPLDGDSTRLEKRSEVAEEVFMGEPPMGWYEPHTGVWHCKSISCMHSIRYNMWANLELPIDRADTQPTRAKLTHAPPTREALLADAVLGGSKVGSNSWGIASVKTFMELPEGTEKPPGDFVWEG
jgi:chromatin structure-remodeling complex protein RSC7